MRGKNKQKTKRKSNKIITSSVLKITTLFVFVAIVAMLYQNSITSNIVADNNRQRGQEKLETVKGSKLKIGDYVNYDHTIQVDPNTKETTKVAKEKLIYTSVKGDLKTSGNGVGTQTVDVSGYKTKWRVYDIQGDQVLLMPEIKPTAEIKANSALGYLWYEKEMHNIAGLYGHGYGADETKRFNYEVGSRIKSEGDTRTETKTGTGARPMLLKDIEEVYGITTDAKRQEVNDYAFKADYPIGSNKLTSSIYYPTLNENNARATEEKIDDYTTGDIGVSKTTKKLTDIKREYYYINNLDKVHTKTYDAKTGKDIQKEIIHKYSNYLGSRSFDVNSDSVDFNRGYVDSGRFYSGYSNFGIGDSSNFSSYEYALRLRPVVFLSSANNYYKEQGEGGYATYSLIKEESTESHPKIQNPYNVSLNNVSLKGTYADMLLFESKLDAPAQDVSHINLTRADGTKVIDNITYTVEGLPEGITYDIVKKQVDGKEEVTVQIYPKELSVVANISKTDIYAGAKYSYDILLNKNGKNVSIKKLDETADGKVVIAKYTEKKDIIDGEGNKVEYTLDFANFNDAVRKDNTYYTNTIAKDDKVNSNEIIYNLNIVYDKLRYDIEQINNSLTKIEEEKNALKTENDKNTDIINLKTKVEQAENAGGKVTEAEKQKLLDDLNPLETKQKAEKEKITNIINELNKINTDNKDTIEKDAKTKARIDELTTKLNELNTSITNDGATITDLRTRIEKLEVIDSAKEKAKEELNTLKQEVDKEIPNENTEADKIKAELDKINTEVDNEAKDGVIKKEDKEAIQTKLENVQKEIDAEKEKVKELQGKLDKIKEDNKGVITDAEIDKLVKEIQDKITKENNKITANETYKKEIEDKLNKLQVIDVEKITADLSDIEKRTNTLENNDNAKKKDIAKLEEEVKTAETNGGTDVLGKKKLDECIADIKKRQEDEKAERNNLEKELQDLIAGNAKALETDTNLKAKADELTKKINDLKETIQKDDTKIKELEDRIAKIKVLDVKDIEKLQKEVADLEDKNKKANKELEENKKTIANLNDLIEKLKGENKEAVDKLTKEKEELEDKNKKLEEENKKLKDKIVELNAEIEQLKNLEQENKELNNRIAGLEAKILEAEAKQNDLQDKLDKCSKHGKDLEAKIKELEKTIKEQDEKIKKLEQEKKDLEKRNKELEKKNKLNEEELKEKELLEKKIKELEEKVKTLEAEKAKLAKAAMDKKEQEQKEAEEAEQKENNGKDADVNNNKATTRNNAVASKAKKNNSKNTSNNKIPHAGAGSIIMLTIITAGAIVYTKKVMRKK